MGLDQVREKKRIKVINLALILNVMILNETTNERKPREETIFKLGLELT